ncbi:MAG TPA: DUF1552 domain-containing protein [Polyangiales bacterium]|nr:DUF1552 domain-containing protein [Polyangiales bacterium]
MNFLRVSRRELLRGSLAATITVPLLNARFARAQPVAGPTRFIVFATPNGTRNNMFWPTGTETNYKVNTLTADLASWTSKLTFLKGIRLNDSLQNGALGGTLGSEHARGTGGMLTARPLKAGTQFKSFGNTTSGWGSGQSLDQYLASRLAPNTTFKSMQLGVHVRDTEVRARISYSGADQPIPPREDPKDVFGALFGASTPGAAPGAPNPALTRLWAQRKSILDATNAETRRLMGIVGAEDRLKLDAHLTSMRDVEQRLIGMASSGPAPTSNAGSCAAPAMDSVDLKNDDQYVKAGQLQMDLAAAALACDQTRILTFQWSYSESEHLFQFLGVNGSHHVISHDFSQSGTNFTAYNKIQTWYAQQLVYFLAKLDSYKEGDRSLLDNSILLWATEIGEATQHDLTMMPYVLAGSAGGKIRAGRFLDYSSNRRDNNQMLVSIAHAMGVTDLMTFGDPSGATGPLPNLA